MILLQNVEYQHNLVLKLIPTSPPTSLITYRYQVFSVYDNLTMWTGCSNVHVWNSLKMLDSFDLVCVVFHNQNVISKIEMFFLRFLSRNLYLQKILKSRFLDPQSESEDYHPSFLCTCRPLLVKHVQLLSYYQVWAGR